MAKILAIDDKKDNLITLSALLKTLIPGCNVITAQSGAEGLKKAEAELPDTILLDIKMPTMDGYEVCNRLKSNKKTKNIPVIMISAINTETENLVKGLDSGADAYLAKPIDESVLVAQVNTALRIKKAEDLLHKQKDLLEEMVRERTAELLTVNEQLKNEIEERKRAEESLQKANDELEAKVGERTKELEEKVADLEHMNDLFVGRELRMNELKDKIKELEGTKIDY